MSRLHRVTTGLVIIYCICIATLACANSWKAKAAAKAKDAIKAKADKIKTGKSVPATQYVYY